MQTHGTRIHPPNFITITTLVFIVMHIGHGSDKVEAAHNHKTAAATGTINCDQRLMEEIFMCVSRHSVNVTEFLLAVGGINDTRQYQRHGNDPGANKSPSTSHVSTPNKINNNNNNNKNSTATAKDLLTNQNSNLQQETIDVHADNRDNDVDNTSVLNSNDKVRDNLNISKEDTVNENKEIGENSDGTVTADKDDKYKAAVKENVCRPQQQVMECSFQAAKTLIENPGCAPSATSQSESSDLLVNDQRYRIKSLMEAILGQYDNFCAHDCRNNLITDMRTCYGRFDLDANLFMSRESHGAVIGSSAYDAEVFCQNRQELVKCLRGKSDQCPESDLVLSAVGLDLELMERGFTILCQNQYTYLRSLECFESHSPEVGICHSLKHRRIITVASLATLQHWTKEKYMHEACRVRLEHIRCDLDAWANKEDEKCDEHVLDLKRRLHCSLIPPPCLDSHPTRTDAICNPRQASPSGGPRTRLDINFKTLLLILALLKSIQLSNHDVSIY